jgi:hypothetical protein
MDNVFDAAQGGRTKPYCESESNGSEFDLVEGNLARYRRYEKNLSRTQERKLIRRAQAGDEQAKDLLIRHFSKTVLEIAGEYYGPTRWLTRDDMAAWGYRGLLEAIRRFNLSRRNGLRAYAEFWIRKFISQATKGKSLGLNGELVVGDDGPTETRADRVLHSNPTLINNPLISNPAARLAVMAGCTIAKAEEAIAIFNATRYPEDYSTTDAPTDDGDGTKGWDHGSDEPERHQNPTPPTNHRMAAMYDCFNRPSPQFIDHRPRSPNHIGKHNGGPCNSEVHFRDFLARGQWPGRSRIVDELAEQSDSRAWRRLLEIGRRAYALELVERDNRPTKYPPRYLYADDSPLKATKLEHRDKHERLKAIEAELNLPPVGDTFVQLLQEKRGHALRRIEVTVSPGREYLGPTHFSWTDEKNKRLMAARLSKIATPQVRQTSTDKKCLTFTNLLTTRRHEKPCSPLQPELPKSAAENSRLASSST